MCHEDARMPSWRPILAVLVVSGAAIWLLEPNYLDLQAATTGDEFLGVLGDGRRRAAAAAVADVVFTAGYGLLGVLAFQHVALGVTRGIGMALTIGAAAADEVENVLVLIALHQRGDVSASILGGIGAAGSTKWGLATAAVVLLMALTLQDRLARRG